jgi:hypothetical protein
MPHTWYGQAHGYAGATGQGPEVRVSGVGSGFAVYPGLGTTLSQGQVLESLFPRASEVLRLAEPEVVAGRVLPAEGALPVYIRDHVTHGRPASH